MMGELQMCGVLRSMYGSSGAEIDTFTLRTAQLTISDVGIRLIFSVDCVLLFRLLKVPS